jgi:hypothetical protein
MTNNHASYQLMDTDKPWAEDPKEDVPGKSKNKLVNRAFAWMFHVAVSDATGSLSWLLPNPSKDPEAAVTELCNLVMLDDDDEETPLFGPVMLATFSCAAMCTPWYTVAFHSASQGSSRPPHDAWFREHLDWYCRWKPECVKQHIVKILKAFYQEFPDARKLPDRRRSSQGMGFGSTAEPAELEDFPCDSD